MIVYVDTAEGIGVGALGGGFFAGWPHPPDAETHLRFLRSSAHVLLAIDDATGAVIGFVTAISDGLLCAYIPLLEVLPACQGQGIGTGLMRQMLDRLRVLYMIDLLCDPAMQTFYIHLGMRPATGMTVRNYDRQSAS